MRILLVAPKSQLEATLESYPSSPPLSLGLLAALTPEEHEVKIIDESVQELKYEDVDLVGISTRTASAPRAYEIADGFEEIGAQIVLGGVHPSAMPDEALQHADSVVIGEADSLWAQILTDAKQGHLKKIYEAYCRPDLSNLPKPRRDLYSKDYLIRNVIQTSRGCPFNCDFCTAKHFFGSEFRHRPVHRVIEEIEELDNGLVVFVDEDIVGDEVYARRLFKEMTPLGRNWISQSSITVARDEELLKLTAESGCRALFLGFESLSQKSLDEMNKRSDVREYRNAITKIHDYGIAIIAGFMLGFDNDTKETFNMMVEFTNCLDLEWPMFSILTPFPGTHLFERFKRQNRILTYDWGKYDLTNVVFEPFRMSPEELQNSLFDVYDDCYSYRSIFNRMLRSKPFWKSLFHLSLQDKIAGIKQFGAFRRIPKLLKQNII